jgi:hypothetical protein
VTPSKGLVRVARRLGMFVLSPSWLVEVFITQVRVFFRGHPDFACAAAGPQ